MIKKIFNRFSFLIESVNSYCRVLILKLRYSNIKLHGSYLENGVSISCSNNSSISILNCHISGGVLISAKHGGKISIQDTFIGRNSVIVACGSINIGSNCQIAEMVVIRDQNHQFSNSKYPISEQGLDIKNICIGSNVWLGAKSTVLAGVTIGEGSVIGAHSLVLDNIAAYSLAVGSPASVKKQIKEQDWNA